MTPLLSVITVSPEKTALSRPWIEGKLSKKDCAYASAARPTTSTRARRTPTPRKMALRRSLWPIGDQFAWILARGLWPPLVLIVSGMSLDMVRGLVDSTVATHTNGGRRRWVTQKFHRAEVERTPPPMETGAPGGCLESGLSLLDGPGSRAPSPPRTAGRPPQN